MKPPPCKDCEKRQPYCFSSCNEYWAWRHYVDKARKAEQMDKLVDGVRAKAIVLNKRRNGRK